MLPCSGILFTNVFPLCALTTEGNEPKTAKGASKEKSSLDVELATAVKLKLSILAALTKGCRAVQDNHWWRYVGLIVHTVWLDCGRRELPRINSDNNA